jgi:hypothetical protein
MMMQRSPTDDLPLARETLHELTNTLAAARMWLVVLQTATSAERAAILDETLAKLDRLVGEGEESCHLLRQLTPGEGPRTT